MCVYTQSAYTECMDIETAVWENKLEELEKYLNDKVDELEIVSWRHNLKFFGIPESTDESLATFAHHILDILQSCIPQASWTLTDMIRAHRRGQRSTEASRRTLNTRPMIVKLC